MKQQDIFEKLLQVFAQNGIAPDELSIDSRFGSSELDIDSVKFIKLFVDLENYFDVEIDFLDAVQGEDRTIGRLVAYLAALLPVGEA